ncbi:hypothetical protein HU200_049233 [Digitaria exilis]|uniref:EGF-like domain-containing protein n=1 Tax=Digitaria exilis TaxID=1010633 RepID=A0A835AWH6_9POAL|nr:hypothetical protein HU200_049233 [Digitaria exilis]
MVRRSAVLPLVLALIACAAGGGGASVCDTANCGKGSCTEVPLLPPNFECHCDPGWSHALNLFAFSPCIIPNSVCAVVSCGEGGSCRAGIGANLFSYTCECRPGYANMLNLTALPCVKGFFGSDCYALGLGTAPPSPAPSGDHGSQEPTTPPSATNGNGTTTNSLGSALNYFLVFRLLVGSQRTSH